MGIKESQSTIKMCAHAILNSQKRVYRPSLQSNSLRQFDSIYICTQQYVDVLEYDYPPRRTSDFSGSIKWRSTEECSSLATQTRPSRFLHVESSPSGMSSTIQEPLMELKFFVLARPWLHGRAIPNNGRKGVLPKQPSMSAMTLR